MKKARLILAIILMVAMIIPGSTLAESKASKDMNDVFNYLQNLHVSGVEDTELSSEAINGMIQALGDPYTEYFSEEEWSRFQGSVNQTYVGVGMRLGEDESGFYVVEVFPGSPAEAAGILRGDYIIRVGDEPVGDIIMTELIESIVGPEGTNIILTIKRLNESLSFELTRAKIQIPIVTTKWFTEGVGYIKLSGFSENADKKFAEAIESMNNQGAKGLVIDLRGNPGGYLHIVEEIAKEFMEKGVLMNTMDRNQVNNPIVINKGKSVSFPVVILVDRDSASASEILAGALQDYKLATIVGTNTFGKGSVQRLLPLSSGSVLKITVEEYLTPRFNPVNQIGIKPDIEVVGTAAQMITALHTLGMHDIAVKASKNSITINGVSVMDFFDYVEEQGKIYAHSRVLAALIDGEISWNGKEQAVEITKGNTKGSFLVSSEDVKLKAGMSFIELAAFNKIFSQFNWSASGDEIQLSFQQGNSFR